MEEVQPNVQPTNPLQVSKPFYKKWWFWLIVILVVLIFGLGINFSLDTFGPTGPPPESMEELKDQQLKEIFEEETPFELLEQGICQKDSDCYYVWYTGGCWTEAHHKKVVSEIPEGMDVGAAPMREGVICVCQENKCKEQN